MALVAHQSLGIQKPNKHCKVSGGRDRSPERVSRRRHSVSDGVLIERMRGAPGVLNNFISALARLAHDQPDRVHV